MAFAILFVFAGVYIGEIDDAPGAALLGVVIAVGILLTFGYWKGEKPRW